MTVSLFDGHKEKHLNVYQAASPFPDCNVGSSEDHLYKIHCPN